MATQQTSEEAAIRRRIDALVASIRAMDVDGATSIYAQDIVSFDVEPPLQHVGADAKRKNWLNVFSMYRRPLEYDMRDLAIVVGDDVAFARAFIRIAGTLKGGEKTGRWLRSTMCFRKIEGDWRIAHDQVSVPLDMESGRALMDLEP